MDEMEKIKQILAKQLEQFEEMMKNPPVFDNKFIGQIKKVTGDFSKGFTYYIVARPGMGKTTLLKEILQSENDKTILVFSLEESKENFMKGFKNHQNIMINDTALMTVEDIKAVVRDVKPDIVAIDYFQLLNGNGSNLDEIYSIASHELKMLAKELDISIISVSQLGRECEKRIDKRPRLRDLDYTSYRSIVQDADCIMLLYHNLYYDENRDWTKNIKPNRELIIAKNRNGDTGIIIEKSEKE